MGTSDHRARAIVAALAASVALMTMIGPAVAAGPPQQVTIVSPMTVSGDPPNSGTFTTIGSDLICESGGVLDTRYVWGSNGNKLLVDKTFTCGAGTIFFRLQVHGAGPRETFTWVILGGTGAYAHLHGQGSGTTGPSSGGATNTYAGYLVG